MTVELAAQTAGQLTSKCNANTFVKVDTQIEDNCRWTISYNYICKGVLTQSFSCKKLSNQKPTAYSSQYKKNNFMLYAGQD